MTLEQFQTQISRLAKQYGEHLYQHDRVETIWKEFKDSSAEDFTTAVSMLIDEMRFPPLIQDIRERFTTIRERKYQNYKASERAANRKFIEDRYTFSDAEKSEIMRTIMDRMMGKIPDDKWKSFMEVLKNAAEN